MELSLLLVIIVIIAVIVFDFVNGFHDASNIVATMIASRSMSPEAALIIAASCELMGPLILGTAVAKTIGKGIVDPSVIDVWVVLGALTGAIFWNLLTWKVGLPSSSSHALVGGLTGSVLAVKGAQYIHFKGLITIIIVLITSPILGFICGFIVQKICIFVTRGMTPRVNVFFKRSQLLSAVTLALSHGGNDAQKSMGIITMVLLSNKYLTEFTVPLWVIIACATAMGLGTACGGWSIIKTVGSGIFKLRPIHGFSGQTSSAIVILTAALLGGPVSTTHVVSSSIMGVGAAERIKAIKWNKAKEIVATWFITIPASGLVAAIASLLLSVIKKLLMP